MSWRNIKNLKILHVEKNNVSRILVYDYKPEKYFIGVSSSYQKIVLVVNLCLMLKMWNLKMVEGEIG
jgi:hypothetical protein